MEISGINKVFIGIIKFYKKFISPCIGRHCRFYPTCSEYSLQAFQKYPFYKAIYLTLKRLLKCHPFHPGGYDPLK